MSEEPKLLLNSLGLPYVINGQLVLSADPGNCKCCKPGRRIINADLEDTDPGVKRAVINADLEHTPPDVTRLTVNAELTDTAPEVRRLTINAKLAATAPQVRRFTLEGWAEADVSHTITSS